MEILTGIFSTLDDRIDNAIANNCHLGEAHIRDEIWMHVDHLGKQRPQLRPQLVMLAHDRIVGGLYL
jgi:hypothetical protein